MQEYAYNVAVVFCFLVKDGEVLLIKRGKPPAYLQYTVVGGKKEPGEDVYEACKREVYEETGLTVESLRLKGLVNQFMEGRDFEVTTYYFVSDSFTGEITASAEGALEWCGIEQSLVKEGISEYYVNITPHVLNREQVFVGALHSDKQGRILSFELHP